MNYELIYLLRKATGKLTIENHQLSILKNYFEPQPQDLAFGLSPAMVKLETSTFPLG